MTITRDDIRNAASTLAYHWCGGDPQKDREGVRRIVQCYPQAYRVPLCAHVLRYLEQRGFYTQAERFEAFMFDMAEIPE